MLSFLFAISSSSVRRNSIEFFVPISIISNSVGQQFRADFVTSDRIRNELQQLGVVLNDEKNGSMSWSTV